MQPLTPHTPQRYNGYIYATAHVRNADCRDYIRDGETFVDIEAEFEVAPGDVFDIEVVNAHPWASRYLVFSDGASAGTALNCADYPSHKGTS